MGRLRVRLVEGLGATRIHLTFHHPLTLHLILQEEMLEVEGGVLAGVEEGGLAGRILVRLWYTGLLRFEH